MFDINKLNSYKTKNVIINIKNYYPGFNLENRDELMVFGRDNSSHRRFASSQEVLTVESVALRVPVVDLELDLLPLLEAVVENELGLPLGIVVILNKIVKY
jgi:hypothetical protein